MAFNLKHYLTEKLQSNIIVNNILNEPGNFFKFYKVRYAPKDTNIKYSNHIFDKALYLSDQLSTIFNTVFDYQYGGKITHNTDNNLSQELYDKLYTRYNNLYNQYIKACKQLFTKPSTELLQTIIGLAAINSEGVSSYYKANKYSNIADIANITDDLFKKYTYTDIKNNKNLYESIIKNSGKLILYFNSNNTLLGVLIYEYISYINPSLYIELHLPQNLLYNNIDYNMLYKGDISKFYGNPYTDIFNGKTYQWPIINYSKYTTMLNKIVYPVELLNIVNDKFKPGKFLGKASLLYKKLKWGDNINDYVLIYTPMRVYNKENQFNLDYYKRYNYLQKLKDVQTYVKNRYKWLHDIYGDVLAYGGTKTEKTQKIYKFLNKYYNYPSRYFDSLCEEMYEKNQEKYAALKAIIKSVNVVDKDIKLKVDNINKQIDENVKFSKEFINNLHIDISDNTIQAMEIYSVFSFTLNDVMNIIKNIVIRFNNINDTKNKIMHLILNNKNPDNYTNILNDNIKYVKTSLTSIENTYLPAFNNATTKLKEFMLK